MPQRSNQDFLTTQTLRERFGLKQITESPTPMAMMKTDLYRQIDTLEDQLDSAQTTGVLLKVAVLGLLLISLSEAAIIYFSGIAL
jgi:hypothetical protein